MVNPLFKSSGYIEPRLIQLDNGDALDLAALPPFLRVLLTTDGTVTKSLESYFWEPVNVIKQYQRRETLEAALESIDKHIGDEVIVRQVSLRGEHSHCIYAHALSYVRPELLPHSICVDLEQNKVGIGELLRECGLETYRELTHVGKELIEGKDWVTRTYRIVMDKQPFIQITEKFSIEQYIEQSTEK